MKNIVRLLKAVLPDRLIACRIMLGPFRGAKILLNPQYSVRYVLGLYEHELNGWLNAVIPRSRLLFDVGANHGYFSFGVLAAWRRLGITGSAWAFEPQATEFELLRSSADLNRGSRGRFTPVNRLVSNQETAEATSLDNQAEQHSHLISQQAALIKIDVEGDEMNVLEGCGSLVNSRNYFVVEVHSAQLLERVRQFFAVHGHPVEVVSQRPLPFLGRESRALENWWVVSRLQTQ